MDVNIFYKACARHLYDKMCYYYHYPLLFVAYPQSNIESNGGAYLILSVTCLLDKWIGTVWV
jgi:hypothetical protein